MRKKAPKQKISTIDMLGSGAKYATVEEMKKLLDELRQEKDSDLS